MKQQKKTEFSEGRIRFLQFGDQDKLYLSDEKKSIVNGWTDYLNNEEDKSQVRIVSIYGRDSFSLEKAASYIIKNLKGEKERIAVSNCENYFSELDKKEGLRDLDLSFNKNKALPAVIFINNEEEKKRIHENSLKELLKELTDISNIIFVFSEVKLPFLYNLIDYNVFELSTDLKDQEVRQEIWEDYLKNNSKGIDSDLLYSFNLNEGDIYNAIKLAKNRHLSLIDKSDEKFTEELLRACHDVSQHHLSELATELKSSYTLEDLVLHEYSESLIQQCLSFIKYKDLAYSTCGLDKSPYGKGINILFTGKSGTGKTMGATVLANELGYPVYKINLSAIVSKWLGETQKNISKIFDEAKNANVVLFFDNIFNKKIRMSHFF